MGYGNFVNNKGKNNPMFGNKHKIESIEIMSMKATGRKRTKESIEKGLKTMQLKRENGYVHPNKNKTYEELFGEEGAKERRKKLSDATQNPNYINKGQFKKGHISQWKGKTKENCEPLQRISIKNSIHNKKKYIEYPELHPNRIMAMRMKGGKGYYKSNNQLELFRIIKLWYGDKVELEYPLKLDNTTIFGDVVVPSEKLWFEYDGERYHSSDEQKEKDNIRQKEIEKRGFKVFRFDKNSLKELKGNLMEDLNVRRMMK